MCTLILAWQVFEGVPVVAAANRDELLDRPARPPAVLDDELRIVAPRDEEAGGTWIGYNEAGVFVAITNRWADADLAAERSRGLLVRDALRHESAEDAARHVERAVEADEYDGFNLVVADANAAVLLEWDGRLRVRNLTPGVHVVVNVGADGDYDVPETRPERGREQATGADEARRRLQPDPGEDHETWLDRATTVLGDHDVGLCVHADGYGTRSSSLIVVGEAGAVFRHSEGPACEADYETVRGSDVV
ncbi:MAG: NRDE family protein [Haloarculaceae archaeon]